MMHGPTNIRLTTKFVDISQIVQTLKIVNKIMYTPTHNPDFDHIVELFNCIKDFI